MGATGGKRRTSRPAPSPVASVDDLLARVQRKYGRRALLTGADAAPLYTASRVSTGMEPLDRLLGGGWPRGYISEVFGPFGVGKSLILLRCMAEVQRQGGIAALIDTEVSFQPDFAAWLGVDLSRLLLSVPASGEDALEIAISLVHQGVDLVGLDSAANIVSRTELESAAVEVAGYAPGVRLWNAGLLRLKPLLAQECKTAFVFLNQVRANMQAVTPYAPQTIEPMGYRSKHDASIRLSVRRRGWLQAGRDGPRVGQVAVVRVEKRKIDGVMPIGAEVELELHFPTPGASTPPSGEGGGGS